MEVPLSSSVLILEKSVFLIASLKLMITYWFFTEKALDLTVNSMNYSQPLFERLGLEWSGQSLMQFDMNLRE